MFSPEPGTLTAFPDNPNRRFRLGSVLPEDIISKNAFSVFVCLALIAFIAVCAVLSIYKTREAIRERDRREQAKQEEEPPQPQDEADGDIE